MAKKTAVVAFSGGLDTSFLIPFSREKYGFEEIITVTVDTGGFNAEELGLISARARAAGADQHVTIRADQDFYDRIIRFLIYGNVSRDGYPLCVGAERQVQAIKTLEVCRKHGSRVLIHGSTGAGNDQYRFDAAVLVHGRGEIEPLAPIRDFATTREQAAMYLRDKGIELPRKPSPYTINVGLWGVSISGPETHSATGLLPDSIWHSRREEGLQELSLTLHFQSGEVCRLESPRGSSEAPVEIIKLLGKIGAAFCVGRHYHTGTSIPGKKGRLAYESPAADIIYEAHRTLEKLTLTQLQISGKKPLAEEYGRLIHEAKFFDPYTDDIAAFLKSTQRRVTGICRVNLAPGYIRSVTADSPYNLLGIKGSPYGEPAALYSAIDARGASRLNACEQMLYHSTQVDKA